MVDADVGDVFANATYWHVANNANAHVTHLMAGLPWTDIGA